MKFGSLKRNYESVANYAAKDNMESKRIKEATDDLKRAVEELKQKNGELTVENKVLKENADNMSGNYRDAKKALEKADFEIERLRKDLAKKDK